jgi:hypothetical protein
LDSCPISIHISSATVRSGLKFQTLPDRNFCLLDGYQRPDQLSRKSMTPVRSDCGADGANIGEGEGRWLTNTSERNAPNALHAKKPAAFAPGFFVIRCGLATNQKQI